MAVALPRRPGVITFIVVLMYIQALLGVIGSVAVIVVRDDLNVRQQTGQTEDHLLWIGIIGLVIAALIFIVATALHRGSRGARFLVAVVEALHMSYAVAAMFIHHQGAYLLSGVVSLLWGAFILWALYGNERSEAFFEAA